MVKPVVIFDGRQPGDAEAIQLVSALHRRVEATMDTERSRKLTIGVSEIGNPCDRCVARKLSGDILKEPNWRAQVGTFIHAGLEEEFGADPIVTVDMFTDWTVTLERRVVLWEYESAFGTFTLDGSCDLYAQRNDQGVVVDWKTQGTKKLLSKTAKGDIGQTYTVQMMGYGFGYRRLGLPVTHVLLYALPRDSDLDDAKPVLMRYDEQVAIDAIARLKSMIDSAAILEQAYPGEGWARFIDFQSTASGCFDCRRYETRDQGDFLGTLVG